MSTPNISSLAKSLNASAGDGDQGEYEVVDIDSIHILEQDRDEFEDETQTLEDLGAELKEKWLQPVVLRFRAEGGFWLVAGERRIRSARLVGISKIPSRIFDMTEEEAAAAQRSENIHRKNLTQREEAKRVKRDLDALNGDKQALLAKYNKGPAWLSKVMAVLDLGPEATKLIKENLTADKEVISAVRQIEKRDPQAAKTAVDQLRKVGGKGDAREIVNKVKDQVKPPSKAKQERKAASAGGGSMATPKDKSHEEPGPASMFSAFGSQNLGSQEPVIPSSSSIPFVDEKSPQEAIESLSDVEREKMESRLRGYYMEGRLSIPNKSTESLLSGMRDGVYGSKGELALNLAAFMQGVLGTAKNFDLESCVASVAQV